MLKRNITIMLMGLVFFSCINGFWVICHGSDGHVAFERSKHHHCECEDSENAADIEFSQDHSHCKDSLVTIDGILLTGKNTSQSIHKISALNSIAKLDSAYNGVRHNFLAIFNNDLSQFNFSLRTIIILS